MEKELVVYAGHVAEFCRRRRRLFLLACFFVSGEREEKEKSEETFSVSRRGERRTSIEEEEGEEEESKESSSDSVNVRNHVILSYKNVQKIHRHHRRERKDALASKPSTSPDAIRNRNACILEHRERRKKKGERARSLFLAFL